jgi:hypothetical protein
MFYQVLSADIGKSKPVLENMRNLLTERHENALFIVPFKKVGFGTSIL